MDDNSIPAGFRPAFWRSFPLFRHLPDSALAAVAAACHRRDWPSGAVLFQRGDAGDYMVALTEGRVRLGLITGSGKELTLRLAEAGECFGELALFDGQPRSADATALTQVCAHVLRRSEFDRLMQDCPGMAQGVALWLAQRLRETTDQLEAVALFPLEARTARYVLHLLRQLHGDDLDGDLPLDLEISQTELAAVLGASRPKVNRALQGLFQSGALRKEGRGWLCDVEKLARAAEGPGT